MKSSQDGVCLTDNKWVEITPAIAGLEFLVFDCYLMLPVVSFLLVNKPHDCYTCLGKDPDRVYSSFQLSSEERLRRRVRTKRNKRESDLLTLQNLKAQEGRRYTDINVDIVSPDELEKIDDDILYKLGGSLVLTDSEDGTETT